VKYPEVDQEYRFEFQEIRSKKDEWRTY
jgi:hypothetical protein